MTYYRVEFVLQSGITARSGLTTMSEAGDLEETAKTELEVGFAALVKRHFRFSGPIEAAEVREIRFVELRYADLDSFFRGRGGEETGQVLEFVVPEAEAA